MLKMSISLRSREILKMKKKVKMKHVDFPSFLTYVDFPLDVLLSRKV